MAAAAKGLVQMGVGIGILTKTKVTNDQYSKSLSGYRVLVSKAASPHQGGIGLIWREDHDGFEVKAVQPLTPNLLSFQLVMGNKRYYVIGIYVPPNCMMGVDDLQVAWEAYHTPHIAPPLSSGISTSGSRTPSMTGRMQLSTFWKRSTPLISPAIFSLDNAVSSGDGCAGPSACGGGGSGVIHNRIIFWGMSASRRGSGGWRFACHSITTWTTGRSLQPSGGGVGIGLSHTNVTSSASLLSLPRGRRLNLHGHLVVLLQSASNPSCACGKGMTGSLTRLGP
jgi:hypothetical protein